MPAALPSLAASGCVTCPFPFFAACCTPAVATTACVSGPPTIFLMQMPAPSFKAVPTSTLEWDSKSACLSFSLYLTRPAVEDTQMIEWEVGSGMQRERWG